MDPKAAKAARKEAKRMFTRTANKLKELLVQQTTLKTLERRMQVLTAKWNDIQEKHETYMTSLGDGVNEEEEDQWIEEIDEKYYEVENFLDKKMEERMKEMRVEAKEEEEREEKDKRIVIQNTRTSKNNIQIEHLKFKNFDGELRNYPRFKEEFVKHIQPMCSGVQLPLVLKSYLVDDVREEVENIGDDITDIWERLDKKYRDQGRLIDVILADVKEIPACKDDQATLNMIRIVERAHCDLKRIGKQKEMENTTIISMLEVKMSEEMANEWVKLVTKEENKYHNKFELLNKLLTEFRDRIEYKLSNIRMMPVERHMSHHVDLPTQGWKKQKCWLHQTNGDHPVWRCRLFLSKPVRERIELVGHTVGNCNRGFICAEGGCQRSHNRLLHTNDVQLLLPADRNDNFKDTVLPKQ